MSVAGVVVSGTITIDAPKDARGKSAAQVVAIKRVKIYSKKKI